LPQPMAFDDALMCVSITSEVGKISRGGTDLHAHQST
jgi:hypothetical protein